MSNISVAILPQASSAPARDIHMLFAATNSSPNGCDSVSFLLDGKIVTLEASALKKDAVSALSELASSLMKTYNLLSNNSGEVVFIVEDEFTTRLHIDVGGNHVRYLQDGHEIAYWVCDEFQEEPDEVIGAVCGMACLHGRVFDYRP